MQATRAFPAILFRKILTVLKAAFPQSSFAGLVRIPSLSIHRKPGLAVFPVKMDIP